MRDFARAFHTGISDLEKWKLVEFIEEYVDAVEEVQAERKREQRSVKSKDLLKQQAELYLRG